MIRTIVRMVFAWIIWNSFQSTVHVAHVAESWHSRSVAEGHLPSNCDGEDTIWSGFCSAADRAKLDAFLRRCKRSGYCELSVPTMAELFTDADDAYFLRILSNKNHVLQIFLPERQAPAYSLRVKTHSKALIDKTTDLNERNFLIRVLYKDCYWLL